MGNYVKKKKEMVFQSVDSLQQVVNVVNEAAMADQRLYRCNIHNCSI